MPISSSKLRIHKIFRWLESDIFQDDAVVCIVPLTQPAISLLKVGGYLNHKIELDDHPDGPVTTVPSLLLSLANPPKDPKFGYTFGLSRTSDVVLRLDGLGPRHFRIHFQQDTGCLVFSDESTRGIPFVNSPELGKSFQTHVKDGPLDSKFQVGQSGDSLIFLGFIPGSQRHQEERRKYLQSAFPDMASLYHCLSPPDDTKSIGGYRTRGLIANSQHRVIREKDGKMFAGKFRCRVKRPFSFDSLRHQYDVLRSLKHENIIRVERFLESCDNSIDTTWSILITELCAHRDLTQHAIKSWPESKFLDLMKQTSAALSYLHSRHIVHNALAEECILVANLDPLQVKISNLGDSCIDSRFFRTFVSDTLYELHHPEFEDCFDLDNVYGLTIIHKSGPIDVKICNKIRSAFPPPKRRGNPIFDPPEATEFCITTAADIWSLGMIYLRRLRDIAEVYSDCSYRTLPYYEYLQNLESEVLQESNMIRILPQTRQTAYECHEMFERLLSEASPNHPTFASQGTQDGELTDTESLATVNPYPRSSSQDPYDTLSPPVEKQNYDDWVGDDDDDEDELRFRFTSPAIGYRGELASPSVSNFNSITGVLNSGSPAPSSTEASKNIPPKAKRQKIN